MTIPKVARSLIVSTRHQADRALLLLEYLKFLTHSPGQWHKRLKIITSFRAISKHVPCAHSEAELLFIAHELLKLPSQLDGDIIECGVYKGGSTCKLSLVARMTGRKLFACDSFAGLPEPKHFDAKHVHSNGAVEIYKKGDWHGAVEEVRAALNQFGEPAVVELVQGYFQDSLASLSDKRFVLVFIDVDLYESIICCIEHLWPALRPGCKFFTHEAHHLLTIQAFTDNGFWRTRFGIKPPLLVGGGGGLGILKRNLGFAERPL